VRHPGKSRHSKPSLTLFPSCVIKTGCHQVAYILPRFGSISLLSIFDIVVIFPCAFLSLRYKLASEPMVRLSLPRSGSISLLSRYELFAIIVLALCAFSSFRYKLAIEPMLRTPLRVLRFTSVHTDALCK
jgi:hypothetical protein